MIQEIAPIGVTVLGSGSRGNATVIHTHSEAILIDAGFSAREIRRRMSEAGIDESLLKAIVVSHEHGDHVRGLRVCAKQLDIPVYSNRGTADVLRDRNHAAEQLHIFASGSPFDVGTFSIEPFSIPHDANDPVGFVVRCDNRKIGIATDLGHASQLVRYQLQKCDLLMVESNHDIPMLQRSARPWRLKQRILSRHGHLSNEASMDLLKGVVDARTKHVVLAHASSECNSYDLVERNAVECLKEMGQQDIIPVVATQDHFQKTIWI